MMIQPLWYTALAHALTEIAIARKNNSETLLKKDEWAAHIRSDRIDILIESLRRIQNELSALLDADTEATLRYFLAKEEWEDFVPEDEDEEGEL